MSWFYRLFVAPLTVIPVLIAVQDNVGHISIVKGRSMQPTLNGSGMGSEVIQDRVIVDRWSVARQRYQRGDVVAFHSPDDPSRSYVKRLVGLPGDVIYTKGYAEKVVIVPPGHCWVEGDNHRFSRDSNMFGPIPLALLDSVVRWVIWPLDRAGSVSRSYLGDDRVA